MKISVRGFLILCDILLNVLNEIHTVIIQKNGKRAPIIISYISLRVRLRHKRKRNQLFKIWKRQSAETSLSSPPQIVKCSLCPDGTILLRTVQMIVRFHEAEIFKRSGEKSCCLNKVFHIINLPVPRGERAFALLSPLSVCPLAALIKGTSPQTRWARNAFEALRIPLPQPHRFLCWDNTELGRFLPIQRPLRTKQLFVRYRENRISVLLG